MAEIETLQDVSFMFKGRIITSISGMFFFKRAWPTRVETVVEEGRRENYHSAPCLLGSAKLLSEKQDILCGNANEFQSGCYSDKRRSASTDRSRLRDLFHATSRYRRKRTSAKEQGLFMIRFLHKYKNRLGQWKGFSLIIQLVMWTRTILFTVGAHKLKSLCTRANPRADSTTTRN